LCQSVFANPILKTKRKIFTPIDDLNNNALCISREIESSSGSEKNEKDKQKNPNPSKVEIEQELVTSQEHSLINEIKNEPVILNDALSENAFEENCITNDKQRQQQQSSSKDLSPSIRLMVEKYHQNIDSKPLSSNSSSSPLWLSPVLDRRVRKQSAEYQYKISKSNSFQETNEEEIEYDGCNNSTNDLSKQNPNDEVIENENKKALEIEGEKPVAQNESSSVVNVFTSTSTGAIPKVQVLSQISTCESSQSDESRSFTDSFVHKRNDSDKPRTPLSERALKIRQAKEAFFKSTIAQFADEQSSWNHRLSQISVGSTDSNSIETMSSSTSMLLTKDFMQQIVEDEVKIKTSSLPKNTTPPTDKDEEFEKSPCKQSKFGLSKIATKLRKVKLKRGGGKEIQKMNTVPVLCRQSLNVDLFKNSQQPSVDTKNSTNNDNDENFKKSKSLGRF
jgi:hypothetical protein